MSLRSNMCLGTRVGEKCECEGDGKKCTCVRGSKM